MNPHAVIWHDIECGSYRQDMALWLALATEYGGPVLDVGAGTGRVSLELARAGHAVVALDRDPQLLAELSQRADGLGLETVQADARRFDLGRLFPLCLVPMQTIQLLGGAAGRAEFLDCARRHLAPGGLLAVAIVERLELFEVRDGEDGPLPDMVEHHGTLYCSRPTAVRQDGGVFVLEMRRERVDADGARAVDLDRIELDPLTARGLHREGERAGLRADGTLRIAQTVEHVGSEVVLLRA